MLQANCKKKTNIVSFKSWTQLCVSGLIILNLSVYIEAATMVLLYNITRFHSFSFTVDSHYALTLSFPFNGQI
jgi:hypothetical protein